MGAQHKQIHRSSNKKHRDKKVQPTNVKINNKHKPY